MGGAEYFGNNDDANRAVAGNVSTIVDLLEDRHITWSAYQEDLPYTGFEGFQFKVGGQNAYVRKHK
jgi:acid phosphatase